MAVTTEAILAQGPAAAIRFIVLIGFVSLFSDMTYEGAQSMVGPYLDTLGASAIVVGIVAGFGKLIGYVIRLLSGYVMRAVIGSMAPRRRRGTVFGLFHAMFGIAWFIGSALGCGGCGLVARAALVAVMNR
jgi:hypothetical protein